MLSERCAAIQRVLREDPGRPDEFHFFSDSGLYSSNADGVDCHEREGGVAEGEGDAGAISGRDLT